MADIQIVFFDIDGTLIDPSTRRISEKTVMTLNQLRERGMMLCVVTGRPPASLPDFGELHFDVLATFNGSLCYTPTETIFSNPLPPETVQKVIENVTALGRPVSVAVRDRLVANGIEQDLADYYTIAGLVLTVAEDFEDACREDVYQIMMGCREKDYPAIIKDVPGVKLAVSWERAADVIAAGGGKGSAIKAILKHYGLDKDQALAFGDSHNDEEMLLAVGTGVAMGNATPGLKAIATEVCRSVGEDGIYHYCLEHGLIS